MGVTGERAELGERGGRGGGPASGPCTDTAGLRRHRGVDADQAAEVCRSADGVVVGSALVRRLLEGGGPEAAAAFVGELRRAVDAAEPPRPWRRRRPGAVSGEAG